MPQQNFHIYAAVKHAEVVLTAQTPEHTLIQVALRNMGDAHITSAKGGNSVNIRNGDHSIIVYKFDDSMVIQFVNKVPAPDGYVLRFDSPVVSAGNNAFSITGNQLVYALVERCTHVINGNDMHLYPTGTHTIVNLYMPQDDSATAFSEVAQATAAHAFAVPAGTRLPEFSIAVFDDSSRTAVRPVRLGVPVISTIPVMRDGLTESELQLLELGKGNDHRVMYFKVISDTVIPEDVTPVLHVYLPEGIDTVGAPISVAMTRQSSLDENRSVFHASYTFHAEDTVNYVDGFAYLSVYMPMEIEVDLPLAFAVTADGGTITDPYADDPTQG